MNENINNSSKEYKLMKDLKNKANTLYRTRIKTADRLRSKHSDYKKLNVYYSILVTALSILSIGSESKIINMPISSIVLMLSVILSYFMFYVSEQNLQERSYRMEQSYEKLSRLLNKLSISSGFKEKYTEEEFKKFYKEYESIIANIENHDQIDYYKYRIDDFKGKEDLNEKNKELKSEYLKKIEYYDYKEHIKKVCAYLIPTAVALTIVYFI